MRVRLKLYLIWSALVVAILAIGIAWALLRMGILFSIQIAPPDFTEASSRAWALAKFSLGIGALTMALIQVVRLLIPIRGYFHRQRLFDWFVRSSYFFGPSARHARNIPTDDRIQGAKRALFEFESRGGNWGSFPHFTRDLYDGSIEQLCAQLNVAIEAGLDSPTQVPDLLRCFFGEEGLRQLEILEQYQSWEGSDEESREPIDDRGLLRKAEARASLTRLAQSRIDAFQIATAGRWRRYLRTIVTLTGLTLSFAVTTSSVWRTAEDVNRTGQIASIVSYSMLEGLIAAFVAMLLRDMVAIIENRRRRS